LVLKDFEPIFNDRRFILAADRSASWLLAVYLSIHASTDARLLIETEGSARSVIPGRVDGRQQLVRHKEAIGDRAESVQK
jgi:hypothetical protein